MELLKYFYKIILPKDSPLLNLKDFDKNIKNLIVKKPIEQHVNKINNFNKDIYDLTLIQKRSLSIKEYKNISNGTKKIIKKSNSEIEVDFWNNVNGNVSLYGADVSGSLIDKDLKYSWNLHKLDSVLRLNNKYRIKKCKSLWNN